MENRIHANPDKVIILKLRGVAIPGDSDVSVPLLRRTDHAAFASID
ncbi:hypothetical protein P0D88_53485 [Paraburkholderia sp. RL18-103-BIB-C]|jgi:hypothetical protein